MRRPAILSAILLLFVCAVARASSDPTYAALRASRPDGRTIALQNFVFERDVFRFTLNGKLHLLAAVEGKTPGAVFIGDGSYELVPASRAESRHLAMVTAESALVTLTDRFDWAVFLGSALVTAAEKTSAPAQGTPDGAANGRWDDYLDAQRKRLTTNIHVRVLQEILDGGEPLFFAWVEGKKYPPAVLVVDPRGAEAVRLTDMDFAGEQTMMLVPRHPKGGIWYASRYRSEVEKRTGAPYRSPADATHYAIDATIRGAELSAKSIMSFTANADLRVLPISLAPKLRITSVAFARAAETPAWTPMPFIQEAPKEDGDAAVVFPEPLKRAENYLLEVTYAGKDVLDDAGDGNFTIGARTSWYPNVGVFSDLATFELRFRTPQKFQIVAVGEEIENRVEGEDRIARWKSEQPIRVAGFNYGKFRKLTEKDKDSGLTFEIFTNTGEPDILRQLNRDLGGMTTMGHDPHGETRYVGPTHVKIDTTSLAKSALADGINTARTANAFYGPLATKRVAITQQSQWFFGQSWPSLIYLPYVAFFNGTVRHTLGLDDVKDFVDNIGAHELAHQWWGHQVAPLSYHDAWLSEGFAEFTAALVAQQTGGWTNYDAFWEKARRTIVDQPHGAAIHNLEAGPISQGNRLATWRNPFAYNALVYSKGAYVLHMLRMAMWDRSKGDEAFMAMMREFATEYAGRNASTTDFQRVVEKHATPNLRITNDEKMDWFFEQWVYGTAVPRFASKLDFQDAGGGKYKVTGTLTQSEVPDDFASIVPIYVHFDKNTQAKLGAVIIIGSTTRPVDFEVALPKKPLKFSMNAMHDVLAR